MSNGYLDPAVRRGIGNALRRGADAVAHPNGAVSRRTVQTLGIIADAGGRWLIPVAVIPGRLPPGVSQLDVNYDKAITRAQLDPMSPVSTIEPGEADRLNLVSVGGWYPVLVDLLDTRGPVFTLRTLLLEGPAGGPLVTLGRPVLQGLGVVSISGNSMTIGVET